MSYKVRHQRVGGEARAVEHCERSRHDQRTGRWMRRVAPRSRRGRLSCPAQDADATYL